MSSTTVRRFNLLPALLALLLLLAASQGCTGSQSNTTSALPAALQGAAAGDAPAGLPELPLNPPATEAVHGTSFATTRAYYGNGIFDVSAGAIFPERAVLLQSAAPDGIEWAMYSLNLGGYEPDSLDIALDVSQNGQAWVACGNFTTGRWEFFSPTDGDVSYNLGNGHYLSENGQFMVAVVAYGGTVVTVRNLTANFDNLIETDNSISGKLTDEQGNPLIGIFVGIDPSPGLSIYTNEEGEYTVHLPDSGNYTVKPDSPMIGHTFTPVEEVVAVNGHETGVDFVGKVVDVRGRILNGDGIPVAGVQVNIAPGGKTTYTGADGRYELSDLDPGNQTVTPLLAGYSFTPNFEAVSIGSDDLEDVDFEAAGGAPTFSIAGTIETAGNDPVPGVFITLTPGSRIATTDASGNYGFSGVPAGSYTLKPALGLWTFGPAEKEIEIVATGLNNQDFEGTPPPPTYSVSGQIRWDAGDEIYGIPHIDVILSKESDGPTIRMAETDINGNYTITDVPTGFYFIRVSGFDYNPVFSNVAVNSSNVTGKNIFTEFTGGPTWDNFAASYVGDHCIQCHHPDSQTSVNPLLRTYDEVVNAGTASNARIQNNTMPPGFTNLPIYQRYFKEWRLANFPED